MTSREFKRWLERQGCTFEESRGKGGHIIVRLGPNWATLPMHGSNQDMGTKRMNQIKKQLGLK